MNLSLDMSLRLQQKLSFQMIQSLKLLQVNTLQLEQLLRTEMELNPILELSDDLDVEQETEQELDENKEDEKADKEEVAEKTDEPLEELEAAEDKIDWEEYLDEGFELSPRTGEEEKPDSDKWESPVVYQQSLIEYLENQLAEKSMPDEQKLLVQFLIGSLDSDGYLRISFENIAEVAHTSTYDVIEALNIIWNMDPAGIGARSLAECLSLQLKARKLTDSLAMRIITQAWDLFEKVKIPDIAHRLGVDMTELQQALEVIKTLNPKPGYSISPERPAVIIPDLIVEKVDGEFIVMLNDRSIPSLRINKGYAQMIRRGSTAKEDIKKYVREKLNGATWLIRSIEQRKSTMIKVMYAILEKQKIFFEKGPPNLAPLKLQDIADMISMHISTVSRVTSNKYVQTPHGIYELKYFFTEAMGQDSEGLDLSAERIKNRIKELCSSENTSKPLSDQKLSDILGREGMTVARRTVAKYREQLKILPARMRQKYA